MDPDFWFIQIPGWALLIYLVYAQCIPAFSYRIGVKMGTQEPAERITDVGVAFFRGFAFADLVFYTPLLGLGLVGHAQGSAWTNIVLGAALGTTVYWPLVCLTTVSVARKSQNWNMPKESQYWVVLPLIAAWGLVSMVLLWRSL